MAAQSTCIESNGDTARPFVAPARRRSEPPAGPRSATAGALALVAHDMRGPLANLSLLIEALDTGAADMPAERRRVLTGRAARLIERLQSVLSGLIQRTKSHGDPLSVQAEDIDLSPLILAAIAQNETLAAARGVRLLARLAERLDLRGDPELLLQALDNLVNNTIKHSPPGGQILCEAHAWDGWAVVHVIDEGPGLTNADLARAFRPFTRLSAVADTPTASVGLGLWIVRLIAENHGGRIEAANRSTEGGAVFTLRLPAATAAAAIPAVRRRSSFRRSQDV